jgi:hypothetical protein
MPEKPKDSHPADELMESIKGLFNGDNARKTLRDAYDRVTGKTTPAPDSSAVASAAATKAANDKAVQDANKSFLDADQAARIRAQANSK